MTLGYVLIVEDDAWLAEQFQATLRKVGYEAVIAPHALAAIAMVDDRLPDVLLLDLLLTGSTAFALLHELQSYVDTGHIPVILCTNLAKEITMQQLQPYGVRVIIDKTTMHPHDISTTVQKVLA